RPAAPPLRLHVRPGGRLSQRPGGRAARAAVRPPTRYAGAPAGGDHRLAHPTRVVGGAPRAAPALRSPTRRTRGDRAITGRELVGPGRNRACAASVRQDRTLSRRSRMSRFVVDLAQVMVL